MSLSGTVTGGAAVANGVADINFLDLAVVKAMFFNTPGPAADPNICTPTG